MCLEQLPDIKCLLHVSVRLSVSKLIFSQWSRQVTVKLKLHKWPFPVYRVWIIITIPAMIMQVKLTSCLFTLEMTILLLIQGWNHHQMWRSGADEVWRWCAGQLETRVRLVLLLLYKLASAWLPSAEVWLCSISFSARTSGRPILHFARRYKSLLLLRVRRGGTKSFWNDPKLMKYK